MRVDVTGGSGFVAAQVERELHRQGHLVGGGEGPVQVTVHLSCDGVRGALDAAWARGSRLFVLLSTVGASSSAREPARAVAGRAEEMVRASGLAWLALRVDILWGPGDVFTNELARLLRRLPFVPAPRGGVRMAPVFARDAAGALVDALARRELWGRVWSLRGPEELRYGAVVTRVAEAAASSRQPRLRVPSWAVRAAAAVEERAARRPPEVRRLVNWRVSSELGRPQVPPLPRTRPMRAMTVEALREYLVGGGRPEDQLATA